jgi:hypothetical protein
VEAGLCLAWGDIEGEASDEESESKMSDVGTDAVLFLEERDLLTRSSANTARWIENEILVNCGAGPQRFPSSFDEFNLRMRETWGRLPDILDEFGYPMGLSWQEKRWELFRRLSEEVAKKGQRR